MIAQQDNWWWHKSNAALREAFARGYFLPFFNSTLVTEYPKSGGTWLSQMLSEVIQLPYPRNRLPAFEDSILHGCWLNPHPGHKTITMFRDGRDIMVSYYYHLIFPKKNTATSYSNMIRKKLSIDNPDDIDMYLPRFIEWVFTDGYPR